jgi:hypothetical protein
MVQPLEIPKASFNKQVTQDSGKKEVLAQAAKKFGGQVFVALDNSKGSNNLSFTDEKGESSLVLPGQSVFTINLPGLTAGEGGKFWAEVQVLTEKSKPFWQR